MRPDQREYLRKMVRRDIRKERRGVEKLRAKFGDGAANHAQKRVRYIEDVYRLLGGDPSQT